MCMKNVHTVINCTNITQIRNAVGYLDRETQRKQQLWKVVSNIDAHFTPV
jgi:hypothetical protein